MTFDYKCRKCDSIWEEFLFKGENPECPKCGSRKARKLISAPVIHITSTSDNFLRQNEVI